MKHSRFGGIVAGLLLAGFLLSYGVTQEVPLGSVEGSVAMQENGKPLADALVAFTPLAEIDREIIRPRYTYTKDDGSFAIPNLPAGAYEVEVSAKHHTMKPRFEWIEEGKAKRLDSLKLPPVSAYLNLYASQRVFTPVEEPRIEMHGFMRADNVGVEIFRLDLGHLASNGGLDSALYRLANDPKLPSGSGKSVSKESHKISRRDAEGAFIEPLSLPKLAQGFYLVKVKSGNLNAATYLNITNIAMVTKSAKGRALAYVTDIESGKPVANAQLSALKDGRLQASGKTGADGTVEIPYAIQDDERPVLVASHQSSSAMTGFYGGDRGSADVRIVSYTERPVYRPGDEIFFKGIVRRLRQDDYVLPGSAPVNVELRNIDNDLVGEASLQLDAHGSFHGSFKTNSEAEPGDWGLRVEALGASSGQTIPIVAYRKPEYTVQVTPTNDYFVVGQRASVKVHCEYYFGGPVAGAKVKADVYRSPYYRYEDEDGESYGESWGGGEFNEQIDAVTDANGDAIIEFDTKVPGDPADFPTDFTYTVFASVADEGDKYFDGSGEVRVVRGAYALDVQTNRYIVDEGEKFQVEVETASHTDKPIAGRNVRVVVGREEWTSRTSIFVPETTFNVTTDSQGKAVIDATAPRPGPAKIVATAKDDNGNTIVTEQYVWVDGEGSAWYPNMGDLKVTLDKKAYLPGDKAKVLLQTEKPGGSALVTVQADRVLWRKVVPLDENSVSIELPVLDAYAPNAYVSVSYVRAKKYMSASRRISIDRPDRLLTVSVTPGSENYKPGEMAEVKVVAKDSEGNPAQADFSIGVVDESIYAIRSDQTDIVKDLYPNRYDQVETSYSFPDVYLDGGDKGLGDVPLRTKFKDTAYWNPVVRTDASGVATVRFQLPDNLTQWRATAIGVTDQSEAGMAAAKFRARKDLMVRLQQPQYMVQNDTQSMTVIVTNDTGADQNVQLRVEAEGVSLEGEADRTVRVRAGKPEAIPFTLKAGEAGNARLTARALISGGASDGVQQDMQILAHGRSVVAALAGETQLTATESVAVLPTAAKGAGELKVSVSPSLAGGLVQSLPGLVGFPYGCVEQTMSRFLPTVLVGSAAKDLGISAPEFQQIPSMVEAGFTRLGKMQQSAGGWGWWEYGDVDPFMTALVLDGIHRAQQAGYSPRSVDLPNALKAAEAALVAVPAEPWRRESLTRDRAYLAYVLAKFGKAESARRAIAKLDISKADTSELAFVSLAAGVLGDSHRQEQAVLRLIEGAAEGELTASWSPQKYAWGVEPTSLALTAIMEAKPEDPIIAKAVRFLMAERKGGMWTSTRDSSYALIALTSYLRAHRQDLSGEFHPAILVNGRRLVGSSVSVPISELNQGPNQVQIESSAGRTAYYTIELRQIDVKPSLPAAPGDGLSIERKYFVLEPRRVQDGTMRLLPSERTVDQVKSGDLVRVELTIESNIPRSYIMIEDPVPSNFRVTERVELEPYEPWGWWWDKTVIRDDRISFFASWIKAGKQKITYTMRAEAPGFGGALPTRVENMYDPSQNASGAGQRLEVRE